MSARALGAIAIALVCAACTALVGLDGPYEAASAADGGASTTLDTGAGAEAAALLDAPAAPDTSTSPADASTPPILVPLDGGFAVGALEVTRREYTAWLATSPPAGGQSIACAWNTSFAPDPACLDVACTGLGCAEHPQVCVDWCDAVAFCGAMGQRLCGKIGGGPEDFADVTGAHAQWFAACSGGGARAFPYGNGYHVAYCNGGDNQQTGCGDGGQCRTVIAGSSPRCIADAPDGGQLFDLSGNAWEWTDACSSAPDGGAAADTCRIRGGSYQTPGDVRLRCAGDPALDLAARGTVAADVGFRCCSL